jgi:hypothetical protein
LIVLGGSEYLPFAQGLNDFFIQINTNNYSWTIVSGSPDLSVTSPGNPLAAGIPLTYNFSNLYASYYMARVTDGSAVTVATNGDGFACITAKKVGTGGVVMFINSVNDSYWSSPEDSNVLHAVISNALQWDGAGGGSPVPITPTNAGPFVNGVWTGNIVVSQVATNVVLTASDGAGHSGSSSPFDVVYSNQPPIITSQPTNQTLPAGYAASFTLGAFGSLPLSYSWSLNGTFIPGATNASYTTNNVQLSGSGSQFSCLVSNAYGTTNSQVATLTVLALPPTIVTQPANQTVLAGGTASFSVAATGSLPLSYFWSLNGTFIPGATNASYTTNNVQLSGSGSQFSCLVSNAYGTTNSQVATLTVAYPPAITIPPANQTVAVGGTVNLSVTANGLAPLAYQWFKDGRFLIGATNSTWTVTDATPASSGIYYVVVTNAFGLVISQPASVAVGDPDLMAWGYNIYGQLGNGTTINTNLPVSVATNVVAAAAGEYHSLFVKTDGTLWAMGYNGYGQLGNGTTVNSYVPINVASNVVAVTAGWDHSLFVKTDGTLWAMGYNGYGQLGNGTTTEALLPVNVASNTATVAAGWDHSLFMKNDGTLWAMGFNYDGQLGNGTTVNTNIPTLVASISPANVISGCAADHSLAVVLVQGPVILQQPLTQTVVSGDTAFFSIVASGSPPLSYAWSRNGAIIPGATSSTYFTNNVQLSDSGSQFSCTVSNPGGSTNSQAAVLIVIGLPPTMVTQPANQTVSAGGTASFGVTVAGSSPLNYYWMRNSTLIAGATNATYSTNNVQLSDSGSQFSCLASNAFGTTNSLPATLTVLALPPVITLPPASQTVLVGGTATFGVTATGSTPLNYYWMRNSTFISGATNTTYSTNDVQLSDSGSQFSCLVSNAFGTTNSLPATLTVTGLPPAIVTQPANQAVITNGTAAFSVTASGSAPLSYYWMRNGVFIPGATNTTYSTNNVQLPDSGSQFSCLVSNLFGKAQSSNATLTVETQLIDLITFDDLSNTTSGFQVPAGYHGFTWSNIYELNGLAYGAGGYSNAVVSGSNVAYNAFGETASIVSTNPFTLISAYMTAAWLSNLQVRIQGYVGGVLAYDQTYTLQTNAPTLVTFNYAGITSVVFSTTVGSWFAMDNVSVLDFSPGIPPAVTAQPANQTVVAGGSAAFSVTASGTAPLNYFWLRNSTFIPGATNAAYSTNNVQLSDSGSQFSCLVSNAYGTVMSSNAVLTVSAPVVDHFAWNAVPSPEIKDAPFSITVMAEDVLGHGVTNFAGPVAFTGTAGSGDTNRMLEGAAPASSATGTFTWGYPFTPTNNLAVTHVSSYFGTKVSLWTGSGVLLAAQTITNSPGVWTETALSAPVSLAAGSNYVVAAYVPAGIYYWTTSLSGAFADGTIGTSLFGTTDAFPTTADGGAWPLVGLRYTVGASQALAITPTNSGVFVNGAWSGNLMVLQAGTNVVLSANDGLGHSGSSNPFQVVSDSVVITQATLLPGGGIQVTITGLPGDVYRVLASTNLLNWQTIASVTNLTGSVFFVDPGATNYNKCFYRLVMP